MGIVEVSQGRPKRTRIVGVEKDMNKNGLQEHITLNIRIG